MKCLYKITLLLFLSPYLLLANGFDGKHTKTKTINKEFEVNSNAQVKLDNKYGSIDIKTWNQNRVSIEVIITTNGNNESKVKDKLNQISIQFDSNNNLVSAKTIIEKTGSNWNWFGNNSNINMDIKYIVNMPITNKLYVDMDYGDVMLTKIEGETHFNIDYGKLIAGELLNDKNIVTLDYSRGSSIDKITNGEINIDYSSLDIEEAGDIDLNTDYSDTYFNNVHNLVFNCDYGSLEVDNANIIDGNSDYVNLKFGEVIDVLKIEADYGNIKINKMGPNFSLVDINSEYIGVKIGVNRNSSFKLIADSQYGNISVPNNFNFTQQIEKNNKKHYEGTYNGSKGKIIVKTQYGGVKISEY
ncbi:DUF4097 family beta strand repeat-containing protein [Urechidicola croceus]|uniref:Adhesin domain-containing protein n=1 Tax=Urechidicola croceus TaxID=1850246 RepID=A0A1D8P3Q8_9FLAO|nr:hypothetical protein [Urechidicola croceus]AOW19212.1 hypothetical protein LPB138_00265 [Urechidicola croceus]